MIGVSFDHGYGALFDMIEGIYMNMQAVLICSFHLCIILCDLYLMDPLMIISGDDDGGLTWEEFEKFFLNAGWTGGYIHTLYLPIDLISTPHILSHCVILFFFLFQALVAL